MKKLLNALLCFVLLTFVSSQAAIIEVAPANARMTTMIVGGGVPAAGGGPTITDDFSSDNLTDVDGGISVTAGRAQSVNGNAWEWAYHSTQLSSANHYAQVDAYYVEAERSGGVVLNCNADGVNSTGYFIAIEDNSGADARVIIFEFTGTTEGENISRFIFTGENFSNATSYKLKVQNNSGTFTAWVDFGSGLVQADATVVDTTYSGTYVGVVTGLNGAAGTNYVDNLEADEL